MFSHQNTGTHRFVGLETGRSGAAPLALSVAPNRRTKGRQRLICKVKRKTDGDLLRLTFQLARWDIGPFPHIPRRPVVILAQLISKQE